MLDNLKLGTNKVAIFTDLHLGVHQNSSTWHNIALNWADWFIGNLLEKEIDTILFTGDFFHSRSEISVNTIHIASEFLKKFENNFRIIMIPGNHDCYYKDKADVHSLSIFKGYKNIKVIEKTSKININNRTFTFCPWGFNYNEIEECDVILGHFEIESFKMNMYKLCEHGFKPHALLDKAQLVFSGHFHLNEERSYDKGKIIYIGSPFQLDFGERETKKGYYILNVDNLSYTFIENNTTPVHKKILLSEIESSYNNIKGNFIKLVLDIPYSQEDLDKIIYKLNENNPISLTVDPLINYSCVNNNTDADLSGVDISKAIIEFINMLDTDNKELIAKKTIEYYNQAK
jgi:DNA repair exonuclease SbcCD nuclease subunit